MKNNKEDYGQKCKGCHGAGVQQNFEGLTVVCPICDGSGLWDDRKKRSPHF